jgi:NADH-quinone oxidoreductase subunit I
MMAKRPALLADIVLSAYSIVKGLAVTLKNGIARPRVTENYPARPAAVSARFRGRMVHKRDESGRLKCTACLACQKACPTLAIPTIRGDEGKGRDKRAAAYVWNAERCMFCNLCVEACPFGAIALGQAYSTVQESRTGFAFDLDALLEPARTPDAGRPSGGDA